MKKILIAEDDKMVSTILVEKFKKENYEVHLAVDGQEAVDMIKELRPDIVICDLMMPFISGIEVLDFLRNDLNDDKTPFIILTGIGQEELVNEAFEMGATDFLMKPFRPSEIVMRASRFLK